MDFGAVLRSRDETVIVTLGEIDRSVRRARLGLHLRLGEMLATDDLMQVVLPYVAAASGVSEDEIALDECAAAFTALVHLNEPRGQAALTRFIGGSTRLPSALNYPGRGLAAIIHEIAYAYGWSATYILEELAPEEAWCYLQEIQFDRHQERKWQYSLSDAGRDKRGRQKPMLDPAWLRIGYEETRPKGKRPPPQKQIRPTGTIINLSAKQGGENGSGNAEAQRRPAGRGVGA